MGSHDPFVGAISSKSISITTGPIYTVQVGAYSGNVELTLSTVENGRGTLDIVVHFYVMSVHIPVIVT